MPQILFYQCSFTTNVVLHAIAFVNFLSMKASTALEAGRPPWSLDLHHATALVLCLILPSTISLLVDR